MATGIIIHITVGTEKRTEFFSEERIRIGSDESCDLQIETNVADVGSIWLELENTDGVFRVVNFAPALNFLINEKPDPPFHCRYRWRHNPLRARRSISFSFFALAGRGSLIKTNREPRHVAQFIEEAALDAAGSPQRDEAKAFLREFVRELSREISWTTKLITLVLTIGFITGVLYTLAMQSSEELRQNREQSKAQAGDHSKNWKTSWA